MQKTTRDSRSGLVLVCALGLVAAGVANPPTLKAQETAIGQLQAERSLPEAPPVHTQKSRAEEPDIPPASNIASRSVAPRYAEVVEPWQTAMPLTAHDKLVMALRHTVSPMSTAGWVISAGYGHVTNSAPHYGTDRGAFGVRLGATALRDVSEELFTDVIAAPAFHQDPRFYRLGDGRAFGTRVGNSLLQPFVTRTDSGRRAINISLLTGNLAGSALTNTYYPRADRSVGQTFQTFGLSMGGSVVGNLVREFFPDLSDLVFSRKH